MDKLDIIFDIYKNPENDQEIDINGTMSYLEDLKIEPEDPKSLVLAYFLNSPSMGVFKRKDFHKQWTSVNVTSIQSMRKFLDRYQQNIGLLLDFQKMYNYTFDFASELRLLDYESAIEYWQLLFPMMIFGREDAQPEIQTRLDQWYKFISTEYKRPLSKDSWTMFYSFVSEIIFDDPVDLRNYSEMSSWPSVVDEYVEYLRENELLKEGI